MLLTNLCCTDIEIDRHTIALLELLTEPKINVFIFHLNYPHDHIKGEESLPQRIALDRSIGSGEIWKMF